MTFKFTTAQDSVDQWMSTQSFDTAELRGSCSQGATRIVIYSESDIRNTSLVQMNEISRRALLAEMSFALGGNSAGAATDPRGGVDDWIDRITRYG
jgi:hypothetical protein